MTEAQKDCSEAPSKSRRRMKASPARIKKIIAVGQSMGLSPTAIILHPDGSTEVVYGGGTAELANAANENERWDI